MTMTLSTEGHRRQMVSSHEVMLPTVSGDSAADGVWVLEQSMMRGRMRSMNNEPVVEQQRSWDFHV